jgi:hypothetical protein
MVEPIVTIPVLDHAVRTDIDTIADRARPASGDLCKSWYTPCAWPIELIRQLRLVTCDRDNNFGAAFDVVFEAEELEVIVSGPRAPSMNAHGEGVIGSVRREALDHLLIVGEAHDQQVS